MNTSLTCLVLVLGTGLLTSAADLPSGATDPALANTNKAQFNFSAETRAAIIKDANAAIRQFMRTDPKTRNGDEIPRKFWGEQITRLKPLCVKNDHVNVAIVLHEDNQSEEGLYVSIPISSYAPGDPKRFLEFESLNQPGDKNFGSLYHYRIKKDYPPIRALTS